MKLTDEELNKAHKLLLRILKEFDRVCEENNIHYFLAYGTLIGAIRHNGFIPWDDDIDIGMLREDFDKFCKIAPSALGKEYILQNGETDKGFALDYAKVILKGTKWIEEVASNTNREFEGLWIDIMPFDKIPESKNAQKKQIFKMKYLNMLITTKLKYDYQHKRAKKILFMLSKVIVKFKSIDSIKKARNRLCKKYFSSDSKLVTNLTFYNCSIAKKESLSKLTKHQFEDSEFYIPSDYHTVLTDIYGDYMQLPPMEKRKTHEIIDFDFGNY